LGKLCFSEFYNNAEENVSNAILGYIYTKILKSSKIWLIIVRTVYTTRHLDPLTHYFKSLSVENSTRDTKTILQNKVKHNNNVFVEKYVTYSFKIAITHLKIKRMNFEGIYLLILYLFRLNGKCATIIYYVYPTCLHEVRFVNICM
jgi:hypothetical protein